MDRSPLDSITLSQELRVDEISNRFEESFRAGSQPQIEALLADVPPESHPILLWELLSVEFEILKCGGKPVPIEKYIRRFPIHAELVRDAFAKVEARRHDPAQDAVSKPVPRSDSEATVSQAEPSIQTSRTGKWTSLPMTADAEIPVPEAFGRYRIEKELGRGAMGVVYLARDTQLHRKVALKIPIKSVLAEPKTLNRFYREARIMATLRHPNICPVYDVGDMNGIHYLTMSYIPGMPISGLISKEGKLLPARQVALLIRQIALALEEAHKNGVFHRDLKPSNVILDDRGEPIVMDFGLACQISAADNASLTQSSIVVGTPAYMAPEQVNGEIEKIGPRSDVYALGVMLYQFLTGELPFTGTVPMVFSLIITQLPKRPSELRLDVDPKLEAICEKMMAKDISQRFANMNAVAEALNEFLNTRADPESKAPPQPIGDFSTIIPDVTANQSLNPLVEKTAAPLKNFGRRLAIVGFTFLGLIIIFALIFVNRNPNNAHPRNAADIGSTGKYLPKTTNQPMPGAHDAARPAADASFFFSTQRDLAEWILAKGGAISLHGQDGEIKLLSELPAGACRIQNVWITQDEIPRDVLKSLGEQRTIQGIFLVSCSIRDDNVGLIAQNNQLRWLTLSRSQLTDSGIQQLASLRNLRMLELSETELTDKSLKELQNLAELDFLGLNSTKVTDAGMKDIPNFKALAELRLDGTQLTDQGVLEISRCPSLRRLSIRSTFVSDASIKYLAELPHLESLDIRGSQMTVSGAASLAKQMPKCAIDVLK